MEELFYKIFGPIAAGSSQVHKNSTGVQVIHSSGTIYSFTNDEIEVLYSWFHNCKRDILIKWVSELKNTKSGRL